MVYPLKTSLHIRIDQIIVVLTTFDRPSYLLLNKSSWEFIGLPSRLLCLSFESNKTKYSSAWHSETLPQSPPAQIKWNNRQSQVEDLSNYNTADHKSLLRNRLKVPKVIIGRARTPSTAIRFVGHEFRRKCAMCNKILPRSYNLPCFATFARAQGRLIGGRGKGEEVGCCF